MTKGADRMAEDRKAEDRIENRIDDRIERIAVLGAGGMMGFAMARNLCRAGFEVRAWNRSREKAQALAGDGAVVCGSPREAVEDADVALTMLADADVVLSVMYDALPDSRPADDRSGRRLVWMQASTIGEEGTRQCEELAKDRGVIFVDSPVLGSKEPAQQRKLVILASGPEEQRDRLQPVFEAIGKRTMWLGDAGNASRLKLAINAWIGAVVEGGAEVLALAEGLGCDPRQVLEALSEGPLDLPYLQMKAEKMLGRNFEPSFTLTLAAKDMRLASEAAERHELDLPVLRSVSERFRQAAEEHGDEDMSATYLTLRPERPEPRTAA